MKTGTCLRPSWTAIVCPTISGKTVELRDQVRTICLLPDSFICVMRPISRSSTNGPFFELLLNGFSYKRSDVETSHDGNAEHFRHLLSFPRLRPRTINLSDSLCFRRVRFPSVGTPQGVTGWRPPFDLPSPPPCGWSTCPTCPTVARHPSGTRRISPEGSRRTP